MSEKPDEGPWTYTKEELQNLIFWTLEDMSDPDADPADASAAYDDHVRYIQMLEELEENGDNDERVEIS